MGTTRRFTDGPKQRLIAFSPYLSLAFLAGAGCVYISPVLPPLWWSLIPLPALVIAGRWRVDVGGVLLALLLGAVWLSLHAQYRLEQVWPESRHGDELWINGVISNIPEKRQGRWRFAFRPDNTAGLIRVSWYRSHAEIRAGQCWDLLLRMRTPRGSVNPGGFDYEGWLFREGYTATAYVREARRCSGEPASGGMLLRWRQQLADRLEDALDEHPMAAVVLALTLGMRNDFEPADWDLLRRTGTSHLMAISGLHIGMIAFCLYFLGSWLWRSHPALPNLLPAPRAALILSVLGAFAYALLSGFALPAQRALVMLMALYAAVWLARRVSAAQILGIAVMAVLLIDPFAMGSAGFWLSFSAVAWIFYLLSHRWRGSGGFRRFLYLQVCLGLALTPLTLYWFQEASWIAPLVNFLLIPVFTCLVPLLFVAILGMLVWPSGGGMLLQVGANIIEWIWQALVWLDALGPAVFTVHTATTGATMVAVLGLIWLCAPYGWPFRSAGLLLCLPLLLGRGEPISEEAFRLTVLDVGQGLSVVIETREHVLVYDAGPAYPGGFDAGAMVVLPYLRYRGHAQLDGVIQSHGDLDHGGGIPALFDSVKIDRVWGTGKQSPCKAGMQWSWDGVDFEFLHPDDGTWQGNDGSCVLKVSAGSRHVLLPGDIERQAEQALLQRQRSKLDADILIAPHHGSASSSGWGFVNAVSPQITIFSAGWRNRWRFPRVEVVERYTSLGSELFDTSRHGAIIVNVSAREGISRPRTWRQMERRLWRSGQDDG